MTARILVVDDLPANVKLLEAKLTAEYFEVVTASGGEQALEVAAVSRPDIILLDVMMPGIDGFEVCRRLKADPLLAHVPVVMVTALSDVEDRVRGLEAGADDFLTKPVKDIALFARIRSLVRLKTAMDELRLRQDTGNMLGIGGQDAVEEVSVSGALVLQVDDHAGNVEKIRRAAVKGNYEVVAVTTADEAMLKMSRDEFDLVIINLNLKQEDGLRIASQIRSNESTRGLPIVTIVEEDDTERLAKGLDLGVSDYLVRPIDTNELTARVRTQVRRKRYQDQLREDYRESLNLALTDELTGLHNRRYFDAHFESQREYSQDTGKPIAILMMDIDRFKQVNDTYGHPVGDEVLKEVSSRIKDSVRQFDMVARIGGEEFVVVMPDAGESQAKMVAERLRRSIGSEKIDAADNALALDVTISIGLAVDPTGESSGSSMLERADEALYEAKNTGRNKVVAAGPLKASAA